MYGQTQALPRSRIAENLATAMAACPGLNSQAALARRSGVAQTTIGRILRNENDPGTEVVRKLARALKVPVAVLLAESAQAGESADSGAASDSARLTVPMITDTYTRLQWQFALQGLEYDPDGSAQILVQALRWALDSSPANMDALNQAIQIATAQGANNSFRR